MRGGLAKRRWAVLSGALCLLLVLLSAPSAQAEFGFHDFSATALNPDSTVDYQAGSHPFEFRLAWTMNQDSDERPEGTLREFVIDLPPGMVGNPQAVPRCLGAEFEGVSTNCSPETQLGVATVTLFGFEEQVVKSAIYNLTPPLGVPARVGFSIASNNVFNDASLRSSGDFGVTVSDITLPTSKEIQSVDARIWGLPALGDQPGEGHFAERCIFPGSPGCASSAPLRPFFTLPTSCAAPLQTTLTVTSVQEPGAPVSQTVSSEGEEGPAPLEGCNALAFDPAIASQPTTDLADSPSGLDFGLHQPQDEDPDGLSAAHLRDATVTLPAGVAINPSAANGLAACSEAEIGYLPEAQGIHFSQQPQSCPDASKIGSLEAESPLLDHTLAGSVYVATPFQNPFGSLTAIYLVVEDEATGIVAKLAGRSDLDADSGQITTVFRDNPQLPIEDISLHLFGGPRAILRTPQTCGAHTTTSTLIPYSAPEGADATPADSFTTAAAAEPGRPCPSTEGEAPNAPGFGAGTLAPRAGTYSPFLLRLTRADGSQRLAGLETHLPPGLAGRLAGLATCSEASLAQAASRAAPGQGAAELAEPSCPPASELGTLTAGAGAGASPYYVTGHAYLAGPYRSAPLSLAIITPAVAGPFDLGTVLVRVALRVDPETAQISAISDPLPQILDGIRLDVRSVAVDLSRPGFTLNPTSCAKTQVLATATSALGRLAPLSERFQVGGCNALPYKPKLSLRFKGATKRTAHPKLIATLTAKPGEANTAFAQVRLPRAAFLDQGSIGTVCTRVQFQVEACPAGSVYGRASATSPLLNYPLSGPVYLRSSSHELPDLVADLHGPPSQPIRIALVGRTDSVKGALRNTFEAAPDAPVSKFRLELFGGKRGLVEMSGGFCRHRAAAVRFKAHNGKASVARPRVQAKCPQAAKNHGTSDAKAGP